MNMQLQIFIVTSITMKHSSSIEPVMVTVMTFDTSHGHTKGFFGVAKVGPLVLTLVR
jgi:hypothetical protein